MGMKELYYKFLAHYLLLLKDPEIGSIMVDTTTILRSLCSDAYLQELQEAKMDDHGNLRPGEKLRTQLQEIEYREPNSRMNSLIMQAKAYKKDLILIHHADDEYANTLVNGQYVKAPTGKRIRKGWRPLVNLVDMVVKSYSKIESVPNPDKPGESKKVYMPYCLIELAAPPTLIGMELREPTFELLVNLRKMARGEM
jgi:hypothetical protein